MHRALVTGGARGIGLAIAAELKRRGVEVVAPGRKELDLAQPDSIDAFLRAQKDAIDILINNAGVNVIKPLADLDAAAWAEMVQVNLTAPWQLIRGLSAGMKAKKWGRIVNISSIFSLITREQRAPYSSTKAGLNGLTRACAVELGGDNILVNAVCPGYVETEMTQRNNSPEELKRIAATIPLRRLARPEEIARLVGFLATEENSYCTGQTFVIDGGFTSI